MSLKSTLLAFALLFSTILSAQRDLEYVADIETHSSTAVLNDRVLVAGNNNTYLEAFSDEYDLTRYNYPLVSGLPLKYANYKRPIAIYNSQAYLVLHNDTERFLYRFNGSTFTRVTIPGTIVGNPVVFGSYLYFLSLSGSTAQLYRYNGTTASAVGSGTIPATRSYELKVAGGYLYLIGQGYYASEPYTVKRYNGSAATTLPHFTFFNGIDEIYQVGSNVYFIVGGYRIMHYNGSSITTLFDIEGGNINAAIWRGNLYFLATIWSEPTAAPLRRVSGGTLTEIALPVGAMLFHHSPLAVYNDAIYLQVSFGPTDNRVIRYNGISFTNFLTLPPSTHSPGEIFVREGKLIIQPFILGDANSYEYDGSSFTELRVPEGHDFAQYLNSTTCNHLWLGLYYDFTDMTDPYRWSLLKEPKGCPPPAEPVVVIPERFFDVERADISMWGRDRGWCWNEIIIDWIVEPCEFPDPCTDPVYQMSMYDKFNKLAWQKTIDKPSLLNVSLSDNQPYTAILSSGTDQKEGLLVFAPELIEKGIESISLSMKPGDNYFKLAATTDKNVSVGLRVELLSKSGAVLWQKDFMAPFSQEISDRVEQPGQTLRFSIPGAQNKNIITQLNISPNPSKGQLNLQVNAGNKMEEAELSITTLLGQRILNRKISTPFNSQINLGTIKPGLYVVKITTGSEVVSKILRVE